MLWAQSPNCWMRGGREHRPDFPAGSWLDSLYTLSAVYKSSPHVVFLTSTGLCAVNGACRVFLCACIVYSPDLAPGQETEVPLQQEKKTKSPATPLFFNTVHCLMCIIVCLHDKVPVAVKMNAFKPGFNTNLLKTWCIRKCVWFEYFGVGWRIVFVFVQKRVV